MENQTNYNLENQSELWRFIKDTMMIVPLNMNATQYMAFIKGLTELDKKINELITT